MKFATEARIAQAAFDIAFEREGHFFLNTTAELNALRAFEWQLLTAKITGETKVFFVGTTDEILHKHQVRVDRFVFADGSILGICTIKNSKRVVAEVL